MAEFKCLNFSILNIATTAAVTMATASDPVMPGDCRRALITFQGAARWRADGEAATNAVGGGHLVADTDELDFSVAQMPTLLRNVSIIAITGNSVVDISYLD